MQPWIVRAQVTPSPDLIAAVGGHPLVAQLLAQRGLDTPAKAIPFLNPDAYQPAPPSALTGVDVAAQVLYDHIRRGQNLLVWGDFDVDGQTSTALLVTALQTLAGAEHVRFHVPNRFTESHGIRVPSLQEKLSKADIPIHLLVSCDTGIAEGPAVGYAKDQGLAVVITDHHDLSPEFQGLLPGRDPLWGLDATTAGSQSVRRADAVVNPKFLPPGDPLRTLPGVGVAYKVIQQLFALAGRAGEETELLDLVALGIVADVAEQVHDARYLLQCGLAKLRTTRRAGLLALMNTARVTPALLTAESIGFQLGPRMNALGRLDDATVAIELLSTRDAIRAGQLAAKLEGYNQDRQRIQREITQAAFAMVEKEPNLLDYNAIVLAHPNWHAGVVGIVASALVEEFGKPAVLLVSAPGTAARGSARTAPGVDIGAAIAACSHLLLTHGGHPGAAGVSLLPENIPAFRRALSTQVELHRDTAIEIGLQIDVEATLPMLSLALVDEVNRLAPFGQGNPQPLFVTCGLQVREDRRIGREGQHRRLTVRPADALGKTASQTVVWWHGADVSLPPGPIDLVYTLNVNEYKNERSLQLQYVDCRPAMQPEIVLATPKQAAPRTLHDWRSQPLTLDQLPAQGQALWYAEGALLENSSPGVAYAPRTALADAGSARPGPLPLVLWTNPPSAEVLHWLVTASGAQEIHLCAQRTTDDAPTAVIQQVGSMCKYALARDGVIDVGRMASRLGLTEASARLALLVLASGGRVRLGDWLDGDRVRVLPGAGGATTSGDPALYADLETQLAEVRAYRRFFQRAKVEELGI